MFFLYFFAISFVRRPILFLAFFAAVEDEVALHAPTHSAFFFLTDLALVARFTWQVMRVKDGKKPQVSSGNIVSADAINVLPQFNF